MSNQAAVNVDIEGGIKAIKSLLSEPLLRLAGTPKPKSGIVGSECKVKFVNSHEDAASFTANEDNWLYAGTSLLNDQRLRVAKSLGHDWYQENSRRIIQLLIGQIPEDLMPHIAKEALHHIAGFEKAVLEKLRYDIRGIGLSHVYAAITPVAYFRDYIEPWYRAGFFPCNWASIPPGDDAAKLLAKAQVMVY